MQFEEECKHEIKLQPRVYDILPPHTVQKIRSVEKLEALSASTKPRTSHH